MTEAGPLNLADADLKGFDAVEAGAYNCTVFAMTLEAVKNTSGQGKMPAGTPMIKVQFATTEDNEGVEANRRFFSQYIIPPADYDASKAAKMKGMLARVFIALGESEEDVRNKKFNPDFEDYVGRECVVIVGREPKKTRDSSGELVTVPDEYNNPVKGVKPAGSMVGSSDTGLL
jgi:hypothetical protein